MKSSLKLLSVVFALLFVASCKDDKKDPEPVNNDLSFYANLKGTSEVPANGSTAAGSATATFNTVTKILSVTTTYTGMSPTQGHIHKGSVGVNGGVVFAFGDLVSPITFTSTALDATQEADLKANLYYINLHSGAIPSGEIRGQLFPTNIVGFYADLKGTNEVPANTSTATGSAVATFNKDTKILTVTTTYSGMTVTAGHIHNADIGVNGDVVFPFATTASPIVFTSIALTSSQEADLMSNHFYVNLHSMAIPTGEIRGQLLKL